MRLYHRGRQVPGQAIHKLETQPAGGGMCFNSRSPRMREVDDMYVGGFLFMQRVIKSIDCMPKAQHPHMLLV